MHTNTHTHITHIHAYILRRIYICTWAQRRGCAKGACLTSGVVVGAFEHGAQGGHVVLAGEMVADVLGAGDADVGWLH